MAEGKAQPPESELSRVSPALESSLVLLDRAQQGDPGALAQLCARYLPRIQRWASGRLPRWARDLSDTDDLVQETLVATLGRLGTFRPQHEGALQGYLRQAVLNRIRDEVRRAHRAPAIGEIQGTEIDPSPSALEELIGRDAVERYEAAFARLREEERTAIHLRLELRYEFQQIAESLGKASADAARMTVNRALLRLAEEMGRG